MNRTLIVVSSNREWEQATKDSVKELRKAGAQLLHESGSSCVTFARNRALSLACEALRGACADRDTVLMLDDDMDVSLETAQRVVDAARSTGVPASAAYATIVGTLAGSRWPEASTSRTIASALRVPRAEVPMLWRTGLGCLAIPVAALLELERASESFEMRGKVYSEFTWTGAEAGEWVAEDFRLCMQLGGVQLLPVAVGHIKKWPIWPDDDTLARIAQGDASK